MNEPSRSFDASRDEPVCSFAVFRETWQGHIPGYELDRELRAKICHCRCFWCVSALRARALGTNSDDAETQARLTLLPPRTP